MMESWDTSSHSFKLVQTLLELRHRNQALSLGSHHTAWINDDFYLFTRNFRDSAVMVMVNKSDDDHLVNAENIQMPDGNYTCLITGFPVSITHGCLQDYRVHGNSAMVISAEGVPVEAALVVVFQINGFETQPGQSIAIIGDCEELGHWIMQGLRHGICKSEYVDGNYWFQSICCICVEFQIYCVSTER